MSFSHDQAFKNLIIDYPKQAIRFFAPGEAAAIDDPGARIIPIRQEQLQACFGERFRELDTPLLIEWENGRREAILFLFEEHTDTPRFSIHKLIHYCVDIADLFKTTRVVPVLILLKPGNYLESLQLGTESRVFLHFEYISCPLWKMEASGYLDSDNLVARLNLPLMQYDKERKLDVYHQAMTGLFSLEKRVEYQYKYIDFVDQYADMTADELARYEQEYLSDSQTGETIMGAFQQRLQKMKLEGFGQGEAAILIRQASRRFGELPEWALAKLQSASVEQLEAWSDRILDANSLEDMLVD